MQSINIINYTIPFFALAMLAEAIWTHRTRKHQYRLNDSLTCITTGTLSYLIGILGTGIKAYCYILIFNDYRLTNMQVFSPSLQISCWLFLLLGQDLAYYWFHRVAHRVNFIWASHIVHHSSEEYNLAVALRQSTFQQFLSWPFYLPLALIGFPPTWLVTIISINLIYQFWFHTREIDRMPAWFEAVFNTPSHHRVHHGTNPQYLDKNYGGILIVWDRWFGTFEPEVETVRYGITVPVDSFNPIWINAHHYWYLCKTSFTAPSLSKALKLWLAPPDWHTDWLDSDSKVPAINERLI
tara:strand:+ start:627 stop:1514 length:888 start_codon:yes stop_codon:yes gene_type:complete